MDMNLEEILDSWAEFRREVEARVYRLFERMRPNGGVKFGKSVMSVEAAQRIPLPVTRVPDGVTVYAVGDVHGRADLLKKLCEQIKEDANSPQLKNNRHAVVFLGDYVDRGFQSKEVIEHMLGNSLENFEVRFLKGNHEQAFLRFLDDSSFGPRWAQFGGVETLISYGVQPPRSRENMEEWEVARKELIAAMPPIHRTFLENLELCLVLGDYTFVHAGLRPGKALEDQQVSDLLWIREEFLYDKNAFQNVVVHGHTPFQSPYRDFRRISVDTGAYLSGRLTAVRLNKDEVEFLTT